MLAIHVSHTRPNAIANDALLPLVLLLWLLVLLLRLLDFFCADKSSGISFFRPAHALQKIPPHLRQWCFLLSVVNLIWQSWQRSTSESGVQDALVPRTALFASVDASRTRFIRSSSVSTTPMGILESRLSEGISIEFSIEISIESPTPGQKLS
jgi:hypothetical protein